MMTALALSWYVGTHRNFSGPPVVECVRECRMQLTTTDGEIEYVVRSSVVTLVCWCDVELTTLIGKSLRGFVSLLESWRCREELRSGGWFRGVVVR